MAVGLATLRERFLARRHTALLVAIVIAFAIRPLLGDEGRGPIIFSIAFLSLLLVALYTVRVDDLVGERGALLAQGRRRSFIASVLAVLAIGARLATAVAPGIRLDIAASMCWLLFFGFVTWSQLRTLLRQREVTGETISMSISIYLLLGVTWGLLYIVIFQLQPHAFGFGSPEEDAEFQASHPQDAFPVLVYFSLVTLATVGYGHIYPMTLLARYAAVAEAITGQFYLAILVARLVSMQMSSESKHGAASR